MHQPIFRLSLSAFLFSLLKTVGFLNAYHKVLTMAKEKPEREFDAVSAILRLVIYFENWLQVCQTPGDPIQTTIF